MPFIWLPTRKITPPSKSSQVLNLKPALANEAGSLSRTPLHRAATYAAGLECAEALLTPGGGDPNVADGDGDTPLHRAARVGDDSHVRLLLRHGASIDARTIDGYTALHCAAETGAADVVKTLESGLDPLATTTVRVPTDIPAPRQLHAKCIAPRHSSRRGGR